MSISLGGFAANMAMGMLSYLADQVQGTSSSQTGGTNAAFTPSQSANCETAANATTSGPSQSYLSSEVVRTLLMMQGENGASAADASTAGTQGSTTDTPLSQLFSAINTSGSGTISENELESYIESKGGTQAEADALYNDLTQNGTDALTQSQLASDLQSSGSQGMPFGHHHHHHGELSMASTTSSSTGGSTSGLAQSSSSLLLSTLSTLVQATPGAAST